MEQFIKKVQVRWSDLDPNFHVLHSRYYDFGAFCRMALLVEHGLTPAVMKAYQVGPILFREECLFKRELNFEDQPWINVKLNKASPDFSRWSMIHELWKDDHTIAAIIQVDGAWMDTHKRKLTIPPPVVATIFASIPRTEDFLLYDK